VIQRKAVKTVESMPGMRCIPAVTARVARAIKREVESFMY